MGNQASVGMWTFLSGLGAGFTLAWLADVLRHHLTRAPAPALLPAPAPVEHAASVPFLITRDQHQQLADLGYGAGRRRTLTPAQAAAILAAGRTHREAHQELP